YVMEDAIWRRDLLRLMYPGRAYSIWLLWDKNPRRLLCWYVNLEDAFRRSAIGFDTSDHELDVVIRPDLTWYLKDEDELDAMVEAGLFPEERRAEVHEMAKRTIRLVENRKPPFCDGWDRWAPDPRWPLPELPPNWAEVD
ncbi:MAG: YgaC family protein, partial [Chloroflexi bacterium]|nr:YgaC family protein [Chloroflexota bacterium]